MSFAYYGSKDQINESAIYEVSTIIRLHIDPEFRDKIPPLTAEEYRQLEENILEDGEVYEPIVIWNGTIVDGHNRWKIICDHWDLLGKKYRTKDMNFPDKWAAFEWMYKKQLGRRNLTEEQRTMLIGKMYESRKKSVGAQFGNKNAEKQCHQNEDIVSQGRSVHKIAQELGVGTSTVERAEKFSKGIDALAEVNKEAADEVLKGKTGVNKKTIMEFPKMEPLRQKEVAEAIMRGDIKKEQNKGGNPRGWTKEDRESRALTEAIVADMYNPELKPYTIEMLEEEIELNGQSAINVLRQVVLVERTDLLSGENNRRVVQKIENIINEFIAIKNTVEGMK